MFTAEGFKEDWKVGRAGLIGTSSPSSLVKRSPQLQPSRSDPDSATVLSASWRKSYESAILWGKFHLWNKILCHFFILGWLRRLFQWTPTTWGSPMKQSWRSRSSRSKRRRRWQCAMAMATALKSKEVMWTLALSDLFLPKVTRIPGWSTKTRP